VTHSSHNGSAAIRSFHSGVPVARRNPDLLFAICRQAQAANCLASSVSGASTGAERAINSRQFERADPQNCPWRLELAGLEAVQP